MNKKVPLNILLVLRNPRHINAVAEKLPTCFNNHVNPPDITLIANPGVHRLIISAICDEPAPDIVVIEIPKDGGSDEAWREVIASRNCPIATIVWTHNTQMKTACIGIGAIPITMCQSAESSINLLLVKIFEVAQTIIDERTRLQMLTHKKS